MPATWTTGKKLAFLLTALTLAGNAYAALADKIPASWAMLGSGCAMAVYLAARIVQRRINGEPIKTILDSTDTYGSGLVVVATILTGITGHVDAKAATAIGTVTSVLWLLARKLSVKAPEPPVAVAK